MFQRTKKGNLIHSSVRQNITSPRKKTEKVYRATKLPFLAFFKDFCNILAFLVYGKFVGIQAKKKNPKNHRFLGFLKLFWSRTERKFVLKLVGGFLSIIYNFIIDLLQ